MGPVSKVHIVFNNISVLYPPHQGNFSLQQWKTTTDNHNQTKFSIVKPSLNVYIYKHSDADDTENIDDPGNIVDKEAKNCKVQIGELAARLCLKAISEAVPTITFHMWSQPGRHKWAGQSGQDNPQETSFPQKEL